MKLLTTRKGMIMNWPDLIKGLLVGLILGAAVIYLMYKGIIPIPLP